MPSRETDSIITLVQSFRLPHRVTSICRSTWPSRHAQYGTGGCGLAVDLAGPIPYSLDPVGARAAMRAIMAQLVPYESAFYEIIYSGWPYSIKNGRRTATAYSDPTIYKQHLNHIHLSVNKGVFVAGLVPPPEVIIVPDDPNIPNIKHPVEFHPVINSQTGVCTGYYIFSLSSGELHAWGPGAQFYGRSEVVQP